MALQTKTLQTGDYAWKSWSNGYVICLTLTEESVNIAANTSLVKYLFTISNTNNNRFVDNNNSWTISIAGQEISIKNFNFNLGADYTTQTIASGQVTVVHDPDGKKQMPYSVSVPNIQSWNRYGPPAMSLTGQWELTSIPRASALSCPAGIIGKPVTVTVQKANAGYRHTVTYSLGTDQGTIAEKTDQTELVWTLPTSFYSQIPDARRGVGYLYCKTYDGNTLVGETSCQFFADIDEAVCRPVITARVVDVNPTTLQLTGNANTLIRYYSDAHISAAYTAQNGSAVASCSMTHNGRVYTDNPMTIPGAESGSFSFSVTDSRGLTGSLQLENPLIPYVKLTCSLANNNPDGDGNMPICLSGNFFAGSFGAAENTLTVQYRYKPSGAAWGDETQWQTLTPEITGNTYQANTILSGLDYRHTYTFQARAVDRLETVYSTEYTARAVPVFDWGERDFAIHGDLTVDGKLSLGEVGVLNTPLVQTYHRIVGGGISTRSVAEFMADRTAGCGFLLMLQGSAEPAWGMAVGVVSPGGRSGAFTLYDSLNGARVCRLQNGELFEI